MEYDIRDEVQVYIPQADDSEYRYHGEVGEIVDVFQDELAEVTGNPSRSYLYTVEFNDSDLRPTDFRYSDLQRPD